LSQHVAGSQRPRPKQGRQRWTSFVADEAAPGRVVRGLHEATNAKHRLRVEHDQHTLLIHLSDEDGHGWTTIAIDRATRRWAVGQDSVQSEATRSAYESVHDRDLE
jgi:hypothetical protein